MGAMCSRAVACQALPVIAKVRAILTVGSTWGRIRHDPSGV